MNIAILGYGIVGGGVHAILRDGSLGINIKRVLDIRPVGGLSKDVLTDNIGDIIADPQIDCVVETIGGIHPALGYITAALRAGKHVVSSNKELMSRSLAPILLGARAHQAQIRFSPSVGGGIPWLHNLIRQKRGDQILSIQGIINGTTNYVLDAMFHGSSLAEALASARILGYAEVDVSADLSGIDTQRKCAISAALAFDAPIEPDAIPTLGISTIQHDDVEAFRAKGLTCKLMMYAERADQSICTYVEPSLLGPESIESHTPSNYNCVTLCAEHAGRLSFIGQGAGRFPAAESVVQDLLDISLQEGSLNTGLEKEAMIENSREIHAYYVRTTAPSSLENSIADRLGAGYITHPMPVPSMHALAKEILQKDHSAFFAGIPQPQQDSKYSR